MKVCVRQYLNFKIGNKDDQARLVAADAGRKTGSRKCGWRSQGDLRTEDVERALKTIFANFKNRLETIPTKYASTMAQPDRPGGSPRYSAKSRCRKHLWNGSDETAWQHQREEPEDEQEE